MRHAMLLLVLSALVGCGDDDRGNGTPDAGPRPDGSPPVDAPPADAPREPAPIFRNPVGLDNTALAFEAMRILGAPEAGAMVVYCNDCHALTRETIQNWSMLTNAAMSDCLTQLLVPTDQSAADMIECTRNAGGNYSAMNLGIVATAADLDWFRYVFRHGTRDGDWMTEHATFLDQAGMPPEGHERLTQMQFDVVMEWFRRGIPSLDAVLGGPPPIGDCEPMVGPEVGTHLTEMSTMGWRAANQERSLLMHGCAGATTPRDCLASETLATDTTFGANWNVLPGTALRVMFTTDFSSSFWTRSSADGRFVGMGGGPSGGSTVVDLQEDRQIRVDASYDPAFFPDNSGFIFHGGGAQFCMQSVLSTGSPTRIRFSEPGCTVASGVGLYEHIGTSLNGTDYFAVSGEFTSDDGGHGATLRDPSAGFSAGSDLTLTLMLNDGTGFRSSDSANIDTANEGDTAISPSSRLLVSRAAGMTGQEGFVLRRLNATVAGGNITSATAPVVGRYCINGGKPGWSYDDRWLVLHHYIQDRDATDLGFSGPGDPAFAPYLSQGAANVYLVDLSDGSQHRITNMGPGQYALFPHFRSDGWIYFIVRDSAPGEYVVASDAAFELE